MDRNPHLTILRVFALRACGEISGPDLTRFPAGVGGIIEHSARWSGTVISGQALMFLVGYSVR
jgi:hypothetical protein